MIWGDSCQQNYVPQKCKFLEKQGKNLKCLWVAFPRYKSFHSQYQKYPKYKDFLVQCPISPIPISLGLILHFLSQGQWQDKKRAVWNITYFWGLAVPSRNGAEWWQRLWRKQESGSKIQSLLACPFNKGSSKEKDCNRKSGNLKQSKTRRHFTVFVNILKHPYAKSNCLVWQTKKRDLEIPCLFMCFMTMDLVLSTQQSRWSIRGNSFPMILLLRIHFSWKRTKIEAESQMGDCIFQSHWSKLI